MPGIGAAVVVSRHATKRRHTRSTPAAAASHRQHEQAPACRDRSSNQWVTMSWLTGFQPERCRMSSANTSAAVRG
jgi:hypothetical protein